MWMTSNWMTNKQKSFTYAKKSAFSEALQKAVRQLKPKTAQELDNIVQLILHKLESKR